MPAAAARAAASAAAGVGTWVAAGAGDVDCPWNIGGLVIWPGGVPGASVGAVAAAGAAARPVNACVSSGASFSARWYCRL